VPIAAALAAHALVVVEEGHGAVGVVRVVVRPGQRVERLARAVQADGQNVGASTLKGQSVAVSSPDVLLRDTHLRPALLSLLLAARRVQAKVHRLVAVICIFSGELLLVPAVEND